MSNCCSEKIYNLRDKDFDARGNIIKGLPFMLVLFRASWCPHCANFEPEWEKLASTYTTDKDCICFAEVET